MTTKRRFLSLIFACLCISKSLLRSTFDLQYFWQSHLMNTRKSNEAENVCTTNSTLCSSCWTWLPVVWFIIDDPRCSISRKFKGFQPYTEKSGFLWILFLWILFFVCVCKNNDARSIYNAISLWQSQLWKILVPKGCGHMEMGCWANFVVEFSALNAFLSI